MQTRNLGRTGPAVSALGLGAMGMSGAYGAADRAESIATVHAALEAGVTLIDTGDFYAMGHNELLLAEALRGRDRDSYALSVKFGQLRGPGNAFGGSTPATCGTSGSRRSTPRRSAGRTPCTRSPTCRSSTRSCPARWRRTSCRRCGSWASV